MLGDVNKDSTINIQDVELILIYINDSNSIDETVSDVDQDGNVTSQDAIKILQYLISNDYINIGDSIQIANTIYMLGDINNDGEVTIEDVEAVQQYIGEVIDSINELIADVNGDGNITSDDTHTLLLYLIGNNKVSIGDYIRIDGITYLLGDANNDNEVTYADVQFIGDYIAELNNSINELVADVNRRWIN